MTKRFRKTNFDRRPIKEPKSNIRNGMPSPLIPYENFIHVQKSTKAIFEVSDVGHLWPAL